jgi:hypothetical protein
MTKRIMFFASFVFLSVFLISSVLAATGDCNLDVSLLNQDPIHAVPGEYVKVVFQIEGVDNQNCGTVNFELIPDYPFSLDPNAQTTKTITAGTHTSSYNSQATIPFTLRVDSNALDDNYDLKIRYSSSKSGDTVIEKDFEISVEDIKSDFDVFVDDYVAATKTITFGILNIGKNDVEALTVEVPKQAAIDVKGSNKAIVGTLDANQDTTFSYEATPSAGDIKLIVHYNDNNGERRSVEKIVSYDPTYFENRVRDVKTKSAWSYALPVIVVILIGWFVKRRFFPKKKDNKH